MPELCVSFQITWFSRTVFTVGAFKWFISQMPANVFADTIETYVGCVVVAFNATEEIGLVRSGGKATEFGMFYNGISETGDLGSTILTQYELFCN